MSAWAAGAAWTRHAATAAESGPSQPAPWFLTRGAVLVVKDMETLDWPARAKRAGLTTLATHIRPSEIAAFVETEAGQDFLDDCRREGLHVEHELHAMNDLLPRSLFDKDPSLFPMNDDGRRIRDYNLCVHSRAAIEVICENAVKYTKLLPSTTGRYFYWPDDGKPMCRCPKCRGLSDSDQTLLLENRILEAIRWVDPRATLAHIVYTTTLPAPKEIKPEPGVFLEFAPIERLHDRPVSRRETVGRRGIRHGQLLDYLDENLEVFRPDEAQVLEYWLDASRFSRWKRNNVVKIPWHPEVYLDDLKCYASRGIRHVTTFAAWVDGDYVRRYGDPPVDEYGAAMKDWPG
jgi:hypothetical protein